MRIHLSIALVTLAVALAPARAHAQGRGSLGTLEIWHVEFGVTAPSVGNATFAGWGTQPNATTSTMVSGTGRSFGVVQPLLYVFGIHPTVFLGRYFFVAPFFEMGGGNADGDPSGTGASVGAGRGVTMDRDGGEVGLAWDVGRVEMRAMIQGGERTFYLPMQAFQPTPCRGGACYPIASATQVFASTRVTAVFPVDFLAFGVYLGADVVPEPGISAGITLAARVGLPFGSGSHRGVRNDPDESMPRTTTVTTTTTTTTTTTVETVCVPVAPPGAALDAFPEAQPSSDADVPDNAFAP